MPRMESLDWQRGLLALSIMIYHLTGWQDHEPGSAEVLGRLGIYGVSMFFVLSGLSMALVYNRFIVDGRTALIFFIRRVFRIWPLLWVSVAVVTLGGVLLEQKGVSWGIVVLNLTTLFGFISPGSYINTGAWSIGNEMVYYSLTPLLLVAYRRRLIYGNAIVVAAILVGVCFSVRSLPDGATLASQWRLYINPFNNFFFYCSGVAIYYNSRPSGYGNGFALACLLVALSAFVLYPASGDLLNIVTGLNRMVFYVASVLMVLGFYNLSVRPPAWVARPLGALGLATYGVYLLHPIVHSTLKAIFTLWHLEPVPSLIIGLTLVGTIAASLATYRYIELPLIRYGKSITSLEGGLAGTVAVTSKR